MNYRSFDDMNRTIAQNLHKVPTDIDLIVGIPRSGLMAANILAMHLNVPITDTSSFLDGKILSIDGGINSHEVNIDDFRKVLLIDDSLRSGQSMEREKSRIKTVYPDKKFVYAAVYMEPKSIKKADFYFELCPVSRIFEWNMMNHFQIINFCLEIDGVLCEDLKYNNNVNRKEYIHLIKNAKPTLRVRRKIGYLVTSRLEEFREPTETWLEEQGIKYKQLIMQEYYDKKGDTNSNKSNHFKAVFYKKNIYSRLFIDNLYKDAYEICNLSGKMVYCIEKGTMISPQWFSKNKRNMIDYYKKLINMMK